jgi:hypothetical protein
MGAGASHEQYLAIDALRSRYTQAREQLSAAELRVFSQNGEDGILAELFSRIEVQNHFFVEFGVEDGVQCNTRFLAEVLGWSGVYIEVEPERFKRLEQRLANRPDITTIRSKVTAENINELFATASVPVDLDLLSIDIDGQDYWVWRALEGYRPKVVIIEYNSALPADHALVEALGRPGWTDTEFFGASLGAMCALAEQKGYCLVHCELAGVNAFFVRADLAGPFSGRLLYRGPNIDLLGRRHSPDTHGESYTMPP